MDAGFKSAKYPGYTTAELGLMLIRHEERRVIYPAKQLADIRFEIARRAKVKGGDWSAMTDGERLHHAQVTGRTRAGNCIG